jgi:hypothetical protein
MTAAVTAAVAAVMGGGEEQSDGGGRECGFAARWMDRTGRLRETMSDEKAPQYLRAQRSSGEGDCGDIDGEE